MRNANRFEEPSYFRDRNPHTNLHHITEKKNRGTKKSAIIFIHLLLFWPDLISTSRTMWILEEWEQSRKMQLLRKQKQFLCKQMQLLWKKRKLLCKKYAIIVQTKQFLLHKKYNWCEWKKNNYFAKKWIYCGKKTIVVQKTKQLLWKKYVFDETTRMFKLHFKLSFYRHIFLMYPFLLTNITFFMIHIVLFISSSWWGTKKCTKK